MPIMSGAGVLALLILISSIPALAAFLWLRLARYPFSPARFSVSLLAGAASFFPALFFQSALASGNGIFHAAGKWGLFAEIFVRIAFTEELSRFLVLSVLFFAVRRLFHAAPDGQDSGGKNISPVTMACAAGLVAGLGFAILESAVYGASNPGNALLRVFTAAPLHGACGARIGASVAMLWENPLRAVFRFLIAVVIHGVYNFMLLIPGILPPVAATLIALSALASSVATIRNGMAGRGE
jgi:RsiW-degrading membrane proteinase PrsW (M82 family)